MSHKMHFGKRNKALRWMQTPRSKAQYRIFPKTEVDYIRQFYLANKSFIRFVGVNYGL